MCLRVDAMGRGDGAGTHISVHVCLINAEHENAMSKGFTNLSCDLRIALRNAIKIDDGYQYSSKKTVHGLLLKGSVLSKFKKDKTTLGYGIDRFVTHKVVGEKYVCNDFLTLKVCSIYYHSSSITTCSSK